MKRLTNAEKAEIHKELEEAEKAKFKPYENKIAELEKENAEMKMQLYAFDEEQEKLRKENAELKEQISVLLSCKNCPETKGGLICQKEYENKCLAQKIQFIKELQEENAVLERRIERAKECMKKLLFIINSDPANYNCKGLVQDAEDFIHNRTCSIRQQGQHCISETRCIMCDKEIK